MLKKDNKNWDIVVLTASNKQQAFGYEQQLKSRYEIQSSLTDFIVIPDDNDKRIGSAGSTLSVLRIIKEKYGSYEDKKILLIHAGGNSERCPQYSALGKIFAPIVTSEEVLFDKVLESVELIPQKMNEGLLILSGDVLLQFDSLTCDFTNAKAAAISFKENVEIGKDHGVFVKDSKTENVSKFLHKQSVKYLRENGAVDKNNCSLDTGAIWLGTEILHKLYLLIDTQEKYLSIVNDRVRLSVYSDIVYCLAQDSSLEKYQKEKPEGSFCSELSIAREKLWNTIGSYSMKLLSFEPAKFIHYGSIPEIMSSDTKYYNSVCDSGCIIGKGCYIESSYIHENVTVRDNTYISFLELEDVNVPENVLMHGLKLSNGKYVCRIIGINDNPKENKLFGIKVSSTSLWEAKLYPECDTMKDAVLSALNLYNQVINKNEVEESEKNKSLADFNEADSQSIIDWNNRLKELSKLRTFSSEIRRLYKEGNQSGCFDLISETVQNAVFKNFRYNDKLIIKKSDVMVKLPLRVNWGGGWSDTCPYCIENGGTVINAAIKLNGELPVEARIVRIPELKVVFDSRDINVHGEFSDIQPLQNTGNLNDDFTLQKAGLIACGIIPKTGGNLTEILKRLGGGFIIFTEVKNVPKGSGLGTSSILATAVVKALYGFTGVEYSNDDLFSTVLAMEQIMSTGGGWQDQVGGAINGIKLISSKPGFYQKLDIEQVQLSEKMKKEFSERFVLINTGQCRLAKNLLRSVVGRYIENEPDSIFAHKEIQVVAKQMRNALVKDNFEEFARLLDHHWTLSQRIDSGSTNVQINKIFNSINDLIDAKMCCGAGGGGFLQVILKKGITENDVRKRIAQVFDNSNIDVWNCELFY